MHTTFFLLFFSFLAPALASPRPVNLTPIRRAATKGSGKYLITFKDDRVVVQSWGSRIASAGGAANSSGTFNKWKNINGFDAELDEETLAALQASDDVASIEEDGIMTALQSVVQRNARWGLQRITQQAALPVAQQNARLKIFNYTFDATAGAGVDIYVIDSGVVTTHQEFGGRATVAPPIRASLGNKDDHGHGTHVASTAAGQWSGVAKAANIIGVKVLDRNGNGANSFVVQGIDWTITNAKETGKPSVINFSVGGQVSNAVDAAVRRAVAAGIHFVVAAGNEATDASGSSPSRVEEAITVGSTEVNDQMSNFSNFGSVVDVYAPGGLIEAAWVGNDVLGATISGTSMATPHVVGAVAALISAEGNVSPTDMEKKIIAGSTLGALKSIPQGSNNRLLRLR